MARPDDDDALKRAMEAALRDPETAQELKELLKNAPWLDVAIRAAYICQVKSLNLKPWEEPPAVVDEADPNERDKKAQALLKRMLRAGLSRFEPDPLSALAINQ